MTEDHKKSTVHAERGVKIVLISDTHEQHGRIAVPDGDVLIHAGDFTYFNRTAGSVADFNNWLLTQPHRNKIVIPGNHESQLTEDRWRDCIKAATVLINDGIDVEGLRIWGSPNTPGDWGGFGGSTEEDLNLIYSRIPTDTDILVTHGPPFGILDRASESGTPQGSVELLAAVRHLKPQLHVFGHIHHGYGCYSSEGTTFINAALAGPGYRLTNQSISITLRKRY